VILVFVESQNKLKFVIIVIPYSRNNDYFDIDQKFHWCFNRNMNIEQQGEVAEEKVELLLEHLATIRRKHEQILAENKRLREVARLAEGELRKRREQIEKLQLEHQNTENKRLEAKARIEHTIEKLDVLAADNASRHS